MENIVTPVDAAKLWELLKASNYDHDKTEFLFQGFTHGFSLGYDGPTDVKKFSPNLKFRGVGNKVILWNKVMKEVKLKRYAGPYETPPFENFIQSPIGLVPKDHGKDVRLIFHLSYLRDSAQNTSVNSNTDKAQCSVEYPSFDEAIQLCIFAGRSCYLSKSDMTSAFRNLGILRSHWRYLLMKAESPIDGKIYYFVDKCLPFGSSISCAHFQKVSNAIAHLVKHRTGKELINYLDDFLFIALLKALCEGQLNVFLEICESIRFPVSIDKTFWGSTRMVFLGLLIDTVRQLVLIPADKVERAQLLIRSVLNKKKTTVKQLQKICGFLNFLGRCVIPGRAFTRRIYTYTSGIETRLKPHHHVKVTDEIRRDLAMWEEFILHPSVYARSFLDFSMDLQAPEIDFYSDASKNSRLGFGGVCKNAWMFRQWPTGFIEVFNPSIEYLELFAVLAAALNWLQQYSNRRVTIFCDNQAVVAMINNSSSSCKNCLVLLRILILFGLKHNIRVYAKYVSSRNNRRSDLLSRLKIQTFKQENPDAYDQPTPIPEHIWPIEKLWLK